MRYRSDRPGYLAVATWLSVAAGCLALGAAGFTAVSALSSGSAAAGTTKVALTDAHDRSSAEGSSGDWLGFDPQYPVKRQLRSSTVVAPEQTPDGAALPGWAPAAVVARSGRYRPFVPTSIRLPSGAVTSIQPVGVYADGALQIPANPGRVGWWNGGAEAGEPFGTTVLAGHVDSARFGIGFMAEMLRMRPGQKLKLANGRLSQRYLVQTIRREPKAKLAEGTTLFDQDLDHRLVMITCGGPFDRTTHHYQDNVILTASPIT